MKLSNPGANRRSINESSPLPPVPGGSHYRLWTVGIDRPGVIYLGRAESRQLDAEGDGRAERAHDDTPGRETGAFTEVDRAASTVTSAASSRSVGVPRTTLTSGSLSIDRAYDVRRDIR
ncbi:hypothetical protein Ate02nite_71940 [Paractinoplanes tereljensis]|uniref:Uncharacterized protein n=1 Tax=Paractinoplanes tereljensis TaxID=571912 RepID=A0A919NV28_9ACTN|nr:hypothetical protein Ate02nite_71940 [Actinoplanes tereljensis]